VFGKKEYEALLQNRSDEELLKEARTMANGLPVATPVFDGGR